MGFTRARSIIVPRAQTANQSPLMKTNVVLAAAVEGEPLPLPRAAVIWVLAERRWWPTQDGRLDTHRVSLRVAR